MHIDDGAHRPPAAPSAGVLLPFAVYFLLALTFAIAIGIGAALAIDLAQFRYAVI